MDAAAARRLHPRVALAVLMAWLGFGLAGCETGNSLFGSSSVGARPPSLSLAKPAAGAAADRQGRGGAGHRRARRHRQADPAGIHERGREAARDRGRPRKDERADYTLRGYIVAAKDKSGTKVSYIWDVTDPTGKRVNRITGEEVVSGNDPKDPWAALTPRWRRASPTRRPAASSPGCRASRARQAHAGGVRRRHRRRPAGAAPAAAAQWPHAAAQRGSEPAAAPPPAAARPDHRQHRAATGTVMAMVPVRHRRAGRRQRVARGRHPARAVTAGRGRHRQAGRRRLSGRRQGHRRRSRRKASSPSRSSGW